jgi:arginyl-tRNA synthetase
LTYSDLVTKRVSDYNFDLEKFTNINGKSAIYLQYAQVRAKKLLDSKVVERNFYNFNEDERTLALEIINFSYALEQTVKTLEPHHIAEYGYSLAQKFNIFYKNNKILTDELDLETSTTRLSLVEAFHETILNVFYCLGLDPVDTM